MRRLSLLLLLWHLPAVASAQDVEPGPVEPAPVEPAPVEPAPVEPGPVEGSDSPQVPAPTDVPVHGPAEAAPPAPGAAGALASPTAPIPNPAETAVVAEPLLTAAEQDLARGFVGLALARLELAMSAIPSHSPLHVRARALQARAEARRDEVTVARPPEQVVGPLLMQAEQDLRVGARDLAQSRAQLALSALPETSALRAQANDIVTRAQAGPAAPTYGGPSYGTPSYGTQAYGGGPYQPPPPEPPPRPRPPRDPTRRGTGEIIELYIAAGMFGIGSATLLTHAVDDTADSFAYPLAGVSGGLAMAASVLLLDLTGSVRAGVAPAISTGIRDGAALGMVTAFMISEMTSIGGGDFAALVWGGAALGLLTGAAVGFGAEPSVRQTRFVESANLWGLGIGAGLGLLTRFDDEVGSILMFSGLGLGLATGLSMVAAGAEPSTRRTLFLDLGFVAGGGAGALVTGIAALWDGWGDDTPIAIGAAMLAGSVAGWALLFGLTHDMDDGATRDPEAPEVRFGFAPVEGGGAGSLSLRF